MMSETNTRPRTGDTTAESIDWTTHPGEPEPARERGISRIHTHVHAALFIALWGVGDTLSTLAACGAVGPGGEANPLMRGLLHAGPLAFISVKVLAVGVAALAFLAGREYVRAVPAWWAWAHGSHLSASVVIGLNLAVALAA